MDAESTLNADSTLMSLSAKLHGIDARADKLYREFTKPAWNTKPCPRCDGKGQGYFLGPDRAPGVCFRCGGDGVVPRGPKDNAIAKRYELERSLARFRFMYTEHRDLLPELKREVELRQALTTQGPQYLAPARRMRHLAEECERTLKSIELAGKAARAQFDTVKK